jgi:hypothetical protein
MAKREDEVLALERQYFTENAATKEPRKTMGIDRL